MVAIDMEESRVDQSQDHFEAQIDLILDKSKLTAEKERSLKRKTVQKNLSQSHSSRRQAQIQNELA